MTISTPVKLWDVANLLFGLNGTRASVLESLKEQGLVGCFGDGTCDWYILSTDKTNTTTSQFENPEHPLMSCRKCTTYGLENYGCPNYRSQALSQIKSEINAGKGPQIISVLEQALDSYRN